MNGLEVDAPSGGCVLKIRIRRSFSKLATYCGSHATDFNGNSITAALFTNMASREPRDLSKEVGFCFRQRARKIQNTGHLIISPSTPFRTKEDLQTAINIAVEIHGLQEMPWAAWYHGEAKEKHPHAHLAFSLIGWDGRPASMSHSYRKNDEAAKRIMATLPYLGQLKLKTKAEKPWNSEKGHAAFRREDRKRKESKNEHGQRYFIHTPEDFSHRGKPGKLSENGMHALSSRNMVRNGGEKSSGILPGDARERGRKPDCVRWQSNDSTELIEINQGIKNMTIDNRLTELKDQVEAVLEEATTLEEFKAGVERSTAGAVEWWQGPGAAGEIAGWSLVLGSTRLKASEISRSLSFRRVAQRLEKNFRRRSAAKRQVEATGEAIGATSEVLAQAVAAPGAGGGNGVSLGLAPQPRAIVMPTRPADGTRPQLGVVKPQGLEIPGYAATRGDCIDADQGTYLWEYHKAGSHELAFSDDGGSFQIHGEALLDPLAIDAFVQAAKARFGTSLALTLDRVPDKANFVAMLRAAAELRGVTITDAHTGLPVTGQQHKEPAPAADSLSFLDLRSGPVPAPAEQPQAPGSGASMVAPRDDHEGRREAAAKVLAMAGQQAKRASGSSGPRLGVLPRDPRKVEELRELLKEAESWVPVQEWAEATKERHRRDRLVLEGGGRHPRDLVFGAANLRGDPLAMVASKAHENFEHAQACLELARHERDERSNFQKATELVSGRGKEREEEIARLEGLERAARAEAARAREAFFAQEDAKRAVKSTTELAETCDAESRALGAVELLLGLLARFIKALTGMLKQAEARDAEQVRERERREDFQRHAEALAAGDPAAIERYEREQKELQEREQFSFERGRG